MHKEQHPIDNLFARKLEALEGTPSGQAWNRLEQKLGQKKARKKGMIWLSYASAAAVVLLLGALWLLASRETGPAKPEIAVQNDTKPKAVTDTPVANDTPATSGSVARSAPQAEATRQLPAEEPAPKASPRNVRRPQPAAERLAATKAPGKRTVTPKPAQPERPVRREEIPVIASPVEEQIARKVDVTVQPVARLPKPDEQTLVVVVQLPAESPEAADETGDEPVNDAAPRTRTGRLLEGLKKVKHGEFRELGLTPDHLLARFRDKTDAK